MRKVHRLPRTILICLILLSAFTSLALAAEDNPRNNVMAAYHKLAAANSFHMTTTMAISMSVLEKQFQGNVAGEMDIQVQPLLCRNFEKAIFTDDKTSFNKSEVQYFERSGRQIMSYTYKDGVWERVAMPLRDYNPARDCGDFVKTMKNAALVSEDEATEVYEVSAEGKYLKTIIRSKMNLAGIDKIDIVGFADMLINSIHDVTFYITIDKNTQAISAMDIDFSDFMSDFAGRVLSQAAIPEDKRPEVENILKSLQVKMSYKYSQLNNIEPINIPDEARTE